MAIDSPLDAMLRAQHYREEEKRKKYNPVSAGRFRAPATMSMLGIEERPVEFEPNEAAKKYLEDFMLQTGRRLYVKPEEDTGFGNANTGDGSGYYQPEAKEGGSNDPRKRFVYVDSKKPDLFTIIHEGGHAQDQTLLEASLDEGLGRDKFFNTVVVDESDADKLKRFMETAGPIGRLKSETIAQKYAIDYLKSKGYSDDQILGMDKVGDHGLYPYSYVNNAFNYAEGTGSQDRADLVTTPDANTVDRSNLDFLVNRLGELYTTPGYLETRDKISQDAFTYLGNQLGRFTGAGDKTPREVYTGTIFDN
jgi:hypothetical protein